jgi:hypothetical protein
MFVRYPYVVSVVFVTLQYESRVKAVHTVPGRYLQAIPYLVTTFLLGWWGFPWGPLLTIRAMFDCINGGTEQSA